MEELKTYIQNILKQIYFDYRDDLGLNNELRLFSYAQEGGISFTETEDEKVLYVPVPMDNQELFRKRELIPFLFEQFLPTDQRGREEVFDREFAIFLKEGIADVYAKNFSMKHNLEYLPKEELEANRKYAKTILSLLSTTLSVNKVVFLYNYQAILEYTQISTRSEEYPNGINYYTIYKETYLKENDWPYIEAFILESIISSKEEASMLLTQYQKIKEKQVVLRDLKEKLEDKWRDNPQMLQLKLEELNNLFKNSLAGSGRDKTDPTRVLKQDGYLKGSIVIVLTFLLGIAIAVLLLMNR